jgi:hypothetical protein
MNEELDMKNADYGKLLGGIVAVWFAFSLIASEFHLFKTTPDQPPILLGLGALVPVALFLVWFATSEKFRSFTMSLNPRVLTLVQTWRIGGFTFLVLYTYHLLPGLFALPAGLGDMAIGITAPLIALRPAGPEHRGSFIRWQILGMIDLVTAVTLGATASLLQPQGIPTSLMTVLPLSMIPTFAVPLFLILHIISIAQARQWKVGQAQAAEHLQPLIA